MAAKKIKDVLSKLKELCKTSESIQTFCYFVAFLFVFFVVIPVVLGTHYPIDSVVSSSMEHHSDAWKIWLLQHNFTSQDIEDISFKNGLNAGDLVIAVAPKHIIKGDVILYNLKATVSVKKDFIIIHRVVEIKKVKGNIFYIVKGDNNPEKDPFLIPQNAVVGKAVLVIPYLGWPKKIINDLLNSNK